MSKSTRPARPHINEADYRDASGTKVHLVLGAICFIAGAAVMVIEISAFRLLAPLFGNTAYTWTALIGVILVAFSAGGFLGGWLADRRLAMDLVGWLLAGAAVLTFFIPALNEVFGEALSSKGLIFGPVAASLLLFATPGVLLGAISPACVRFYSLVNKDTHVGAAAGTISMLGSLGSFAGTFLSGFYLLSNFGVKSVFLGTATLLLLLSALAFFLAKNTWRQQVPVWAGGLFAAWFGVTANDRPADNVVWWRDTFYHRIEVSENGEGANKMRFLHLDSTVEGGIKLADGSLVLDYQRFWKLPLLRDGFDVKHALFLGAGAFGMPCEVSRLFPEAAVDVVELDPAVVEAGRRYFNLDKHPKVVAHNADARSFVRRSSQKWDLIFGDAYNGVRAIPAQLASREFFKQVREHLAPHGVFLMNVITAVDGPKAELLAGMLATLHEAFPHVHAFPVNGGGGQAQNVILMAAGEDWTPLFTEHTYAPGSWQAQLSQAFFPPARLPSGGQIFTDDLNPVDAVIARALLE
ncbi:MAG: fused MFS/spermidine synthase [Verrucomicrobiaceae bacterium]|nr:fused MFS/spermidine synthase [Verrucomicrobiaceae bacterium]